MANKHDDGWCVLINIPEWTRAKRVKIVNIDGVRGIDTTTIRSKSTRWDSKEEAEAWIKSVEHMFDNLVAMKAAKY